MRRASMAIPSVGEPLIVVEESAGEEAEVGDVGRVEYEGSEDHDSPPDPYLLSPWRDTRKHSLPTPACTSGPTASQVRRLSEQGETAAKEAREAAFLATLTQPNAQPGGRRHSVVTISRVPQALFGRGRRESIAAFPALRRRDSGAGVGPAALENLGSSHNLQLDIMDDIVQARKVRMKLWNTSNERVCEVQPLDERSGSVRYTNRGRRHSDFAKIPLPPIPSRRRASELPPAPPIPPRISSGIVCTNNDLIRLLDLTSSATEINRCGELKPQNQKIRRLADARSNSFDASSLRDTPSAGGTWFARRHQTLEVKNEKEKSTNKLDIGNKEKQGKASVLWDRAGSVVDAGALGSAIEVFLKKGSEPQPSTSGISVPIPSITKPPPPRPPPRNIQKLTSEKWCPANKRQEEEENADGCDASLCSSIKDLFT